MRYDVTTERLGLMALFDIQGDRAAVAKWVGDALPPLPERPNTRSSGGGADVFFIGPNHWIARAPIEREEALNARLNPTDCPADISIVRVSDTLTFFRATGPEAAEIMAIACPLDLHASVFGAEAVTHTEVFGLKALVLRCDGGFEFAVEQSFGDMVEDYLARALA
ncbi:sarcosine oxidase subunit gamma [Ovoidimarina sediminis]|uniref:sarcosine oxidase subunit gamma n=1 Tax=Ovoidimarina sediminis TaxID=3079856 RepID=UPI00291178E6|nr:sarcosine oxidase subunit gamma [Rhodophyticola sp. MJ-SS7]MDU8944112.1 sarcosine oxidase subunit gamma [Rhodophyticola sp. MJ-SS7]